MRKAVFVDLKANTEKSKDKKLLAKLNSKDITLSDRNEYRTKDENLEFETAKKLPKLTAR